MTYCRLQMERDNASSGQGQMQRMGMAAAGSPACLQTQGALFPEQIEFVPYENPWEQMTL